MNARDAGPVNATIDQLNQTAAELAEGRDKGKALKYQRMKEQGALPAHIVHLIEQESKKSTSKRAFVTNAINKLFSRQEDGSSSLNLKDPLFQKALPESVMCGLYFNNNVQAFQNALKKGEIARVEDDHGIPYFAFKSFEIGRVDGKSLTQTRTGHQSLTKEADQGAHQGL